MHVRTSQSVIRTPAGEVAWRTEPLPPEERWLLGATRNPVVWGEMLAASERWPASRMEQALGQALRKGWMQIAAEEEAASPLPQDSSAQTLTDLLNRYEAPVSTEVMALSPPEAWAEGVPEAEAEEVIFDPAALFSGAAGHIESAAAEEAPAEDDSLWRAMGLTEDHVGPDFMGQPYDPLNGAVEMEAPPEILEIPPYVGQPAAPQSTPSEGLPRVKDAVKGPWQQAQSEPAPHGVPSELGRQRERLRRQSVERKAAQEQHRLEQAARQKVVDERQERVAQQRRREEQQRSGSTLMGLAERLKKLQEDQRRRGGGK